MAACGRGDGACQVVHSDNARRRHYTSPQQARIQPPPGRAVPLQSQPRLPLSGDDLRWDSHSSERFVGHPFLAVAAGCYTQRELIEREERYLERTFAEEYLVYKRMVRC